MPKSSILSQIEAMSPDRFKQLCQKIVVGLGFAHAREFSLSEIPVAFQETIERTSTDGMFRTKESWLLAFARLGTQPIVSALEVIVQTAQATRMQNVLVVAFGNIDSGVVEKYHAYARNAGLRSALLTANFAKILAQDYAQHMFKPTEKSTFSFAELRGRMKQQAQEATWRKQFVSVTALPIRVNKIRRKDLGEKTKETTESDQNILDEADLFGAIHKTQSFLLLGDPGAGKTTCLQELAEELANVGGRTPVFLPLNRYEGNLLRDLGEALCGETDILSEQEVEDLLSSGALTVILDGVNEVQSQTLQPELIKQINALTSPEAPTARSHWVVSSRRYDYDYVPQLVHLDKHTWELLPLTSDLIYDFLRKSLGEKEGKAAYASLGSSMREVCSNPLLLNMLLYVRNERGTLSANRGTLYHQFIDLLLHRGERLPNYQRNLVDLSKLIGYNHTMTIDEYCRLTYSALSDLANEMQEKGTITIGLAELFHIFERNTTLATGINPEEAAKALHNSLLIRGILKFATGKTTFFHHTFQEYFHAEKLKEVPLEMLIRTGGVSAAIHETLVFMASTLDSPDKLQALINRVLDYGNDVSLADAIRRNASIPIDEETLHKIALALWRRIAWVESIYIGANKRFAQMFMHMATDLGQSAEQLLRAILDPLDEKVLIAKQLKLYQELGDTSAQQRLLDTIDLLHGEDISDDLLFRMAVAADGQKAIELYTQYIERYPNNSAAYGNRALAYENLENREKAEKDYKQSIALAPDRPLSRTNYAIFLLQHNREEQALEELMIAVKSEKRYHQAHFELGKLLEAKDPSEALFHLEEATKLAPDPDRQTKYLQRLLKIQEKLGRFAGAMISIRRLIDLNPTSSQVSEWKQHFARLRQAYGEQVQKHRAESGEASLSLLSRTVLRMAGWDIDHAGLQWLQAVSDSPGRISTLSVLLLDVPHLTGPLVQERITALENEERAIKSIVVFTAAEMVDREARIYLAQCQYHLAFITAVELREAMIKGERSCYQLLTNALSRASVHDNAFRYTQLVQESSEFFGREHQKDKFTSFILRHEIVGLYGIHKIGKSSFLRQIRQHLTVYERNITPIWVEMSAAIKHPADLYRKILGELYGETGRSQGQMLSAEQFQQKLYAFHKGRQSHYTGHQILLILDEYPYLIPGRSGEQGITDYMEVLGLFKVLSQEGWFNLLPCGRTTALSRVSRWPEGENPFIGMLQEQFLEPLTRNEVEELVKVLGYKTGLEFRDEAIERMWILAGGHPFFTRTLGSWVHQKLSRSAKNAITSVTEAVVDEAVEVFLRSGSSSEIALLQKIYREELEDEEHRIVKILAQSDRPLPPIALIPDNASKEDRYRVRMAVENLLATSVLQRDEQKRLSHRYELLRRVIVQDMEEASLYGEDDL